MGPLPAPFGRLWKPYMKSLIRGSSPYPIRAPPPRPPERRPHRADPARERKRGALPNQATMMLIDDGEAPTPTKVGPAAGGGVPLAARAGHRPPRLIRARERKFRRTRKSAVRDD